MWYSRSVISFVLPSSGRFFIVFSLIWMGLFTGYAVAALEECGLTSPLDRKDSMFSCGLVGMAIPLSWMCLLTCSWWNNKLYHLRRVIEYYSREHDRTEKKLRTIQERFDAEPTPMLESYILSLGKRRDRALNMLRVLRELQIPLETEFEQFRKPMPLVREQ